MLNFPPSTMPPTGENWFSPAHGRAVPGNGGGGSVPDGPAQAVFNNNIPVLPNVPPPQSFPAGIPPPPSLATPPIVDPAFFATAIYHPPPPPNAVIPLVPPPLNTPPPTIPPPPPPSAPPSSAAASTSLPPVLDPHKANEAEALKFISENEKVLKGARKRSGSRDYGNKFGSGGSSRGDRGREPDRRRASREDIRARSRSRSRPRYRSRSRSRGSRISSRDRGDSKRRSGERSLSRNQLYSSNNGKSHSSRAAETRDDYSKNNRSKSDDRSSRIMASKSRKEIPPHLSSSKQQRRPSSPRRERTPPPPSSNLESRRNFPQHRPPARLEKSVEIPVVKDNHVDLNDRKTSRNSDLRLESKRNVNGNEEIRSHSNSGKGPRWPYLQGSTGNDGSRLSSNNVPNRGRGGISNSGKRDRPFRVQHHPRPGAVTDKSPNFRDRSGDRSRYEYSAEKTKIMLEEKKKDSEEEDNIEEWVRSAPSELYYTRAANGDMVATDRAKQLCHKFYSRLVKEAKEKRVEAEACGVEHLTKLIEEEKKENEHKKCQKTHGHKSCNSKNDSSSDSDSASDDSDCEEIASRSDTSNRELERRKKHPRRLHTELWHNEPGQMNDGPVCRCSAKARRFGIRHGFYPGEKLERICDPFSNNSSKLYHYKILINPATNLVIRSPTVITHDSHEYIFEGFSIFSHYKLDEKLPPCRVIRFNIRYCMAVAEETFPQNFCVQELKLFETYIFREILELVDLSYPNEGDPDGGICNQFHLMPRFARQLPENGKELLSMDKVLQHLIKSDRELIEESELRKYLSVDQSVWQDFADKHKGTIVVKRGMKPCAIRVDQIDRNVECQENEEDGIPFPLIVHFGIRPPQLSYAGNVEYQRAWRRFVKYRHLLSNMPKPKIEDKRKLLEKDLKLQEMRTRSTMKRDVTVDISAKGFRTTGICCDLVQHAMLIPVLFAHMRFHKSLDELEKQMNYEFKNRYLLQLAMTHPSYRENFGTNPDHARNALTNCGIRQPEYGDRSIHYASSRKRGINTLIDIMARFGMKYETESEITHNERLEFLGDAVVEFVTSIHLFHIFPDLEEGGLATYRAAIVQNQHLAVLAQNLGLDRFMLYAHGSDLCHDSELRHAMANCFEALMGALFLDDGVEVWTQVRTADHVFAKTMYGNDDVVYDIWTNYPRHPLQVEEPKGDRHWIKSHVALQKLTKFEEDTGIEFNHIRLLARAFTDRSLGYNNLSRGSNQRLEFLGDTVLQLIASEYLYRHFPDHHEGHLSLLRSSLVNNRTQSVVCDVLGMTEYAMRHDPKLEMKTKDRADLLEAFLGALYIDQGLEACVVFCSVCFFPRLTESIINQDWNDPKSKLQQCCLTLRSMDGKEPEIPTYKVTEVMGPTNTRVYKVAVYFKNKRLATSRGHSIQEAEMNAASNALVKRDYLFPQLKHQKRLLEKTTKKISQSQFFDFKP